MIVKIVNVRAVSIKDVNNNDHSHWLRPRLSLNGTLSSLLSNSLLHSHLFARPGLGSFDGENVDFKKGKSKLF